jgi:hypothetical protein
MKLAIIRSKKTELFQLENTIKCQSSVRGRVVRHTREADRIFKTKDWKLFFSTRMREYKKCKLNELKQLINHSLYHQLTHEVVFLKLK